MQVQIVENVLKMNDEIAAMNRQIITRAGVFAIDVMGAPGAGKTALIEKTIQLLSESKRVGVIVGDLATQRDADRMARYSRHVVQINTGKTCHLEAHHVHQALKKIDLSSIDLLFIENVGNLICPVGFDLGQHVKVGLFNVSGGDDKAAKHPYIVCESDVLLLTQTDLLPYVPFNLPLFRDDIQRLKPGAELIELSVVSGAGVNRWIEWIVRMIHRRDAEIAERKI